MKKRLLGIAAAAAMLTSTLTPVYADNIGVSDIMSDTVTLGFSADEDELLEDEFFKAEGDWWQWDSSKTVLTLRGQLPDTFFDEEENKDHGLGYFAENFNAEKIIITPGTKAGTSAEYMFANFWKLEEIEGLGNLDTSNVTSMFAMFGGCMKLKSVDLSGMDLRKVTDMSYMCNDCRALESFDISGCSTPNLQKTSCMFRMCESLYSVDMTGGFTTKNVFDMGNMFWACSALPYLDMTNFNMSKVQFATSMFSGDEALTRLKLPKGFTVIADMRLPNNTTGHLGWTKTGYSIISGRSGDAVFTADTAGEYRRIRALETPPSPKITTVTPGNGRAAVKWNAADSATEYKLKYTASDGVTRTVSCTGTSKTISLPEGRCDIWVIAVINGQETSQKYVKSVDIRNHGITVNVRAGTAAGNVTLSWAAYDGASKYKIICLDASGNIKTTRETVNTSFNWNGLAAGVKYGFCVQPCLGTYPLFDAANAKDKAYIKYYTPETASPKINKISTGNKKAWVYWDKTANATSYRVYVIQDGVERCAGTTTANKMLVTGMKNGVRAYYYVKAVVGGKLTTQKNKAYSTPRNGVKPTVTKSSGTASIKWAKYSGATKYKVVQVDANRKKIAERTTAGTAFDWKGLAKGKKYGFYIQPYVGDEYIPFGLSYAEDQANIVYITV